MNKFRFWPRLMMIGGLTALWGWLVWSTYRPVSAAPAAVLNVCSSCEFTTAAEALTAAAAGDTIVISATTHTEPGLTVNKSVTIQGLEAVNTSWFLSGSPLTITAGQEVTLTQISLNAQGLSRVLINQGDLQLRAAVLQNGSSPEFEAGGGLYNSGSAWVESSGLYGNSAHDGAGIYNASTGVLTVYTSTISGNNIFEEGANGGGVFNAGLAIFDNSTIHDNTANLAGGGIYNSPAGLLQVYDSTIHSNRVYVGGPGAGLSNEGTATIENSMVRDNRVWSNSGLGAGIGNSGEITLTNTTIWNNRPLDEGMIGAGLYNNPSGRVWLISSTVKDNNAWRGQAGGMYNEGQLWITATLFTQNMSTYGGGGLWNTASGRVWIADSTFEFNKSDYVHHGGGINNYGHLTVHNSHFIKNSTYAWRGLATGGAIASTGQLTVTGSSFVENFVTIDAEEEWERGYGGAIAVNGGEASITSSLFKGNSLRSGSYDWESDRAYGGALYVGDSATAEVINNTFSENYISAPPGTNSYQWGGAVMNLGQLTLAYNTIISNSSYVGGGLAQGSSGGATVWGNIIVGNEAGDCVGEITSAGYNLFGDGTGCPETEPTDLVIDPTELFTTTLYPLADYGGGTETYALRPGSPALNHIPAGEAGCGTTVTNDQRGEPRPQETACDVGAFEGNFTPSHHQVTLTIDGPAGNGVSNSWDETTCWATCVYTVPHGVTITFTAVLTSGSVFESWSNECGAGSSCTQTITAPLTLTAGFDLLNYPVTVTVDGPAGNGITNSWDETTCWATCVYTVPHGLTMTFTAVLTSGSVFESWSNECGSGSSCTQTITAPLTLTAGFEAVLPPANYQQFLPLIVR